MEPSPRESTRSILLVEPQFLFRRTIASVVRELELATVHEATSVAKAADLVSMARFDALIIDLDPGGAALALIAQIRAGESECDTDLPVAALVGTCDAAMVARIKELNVRCMVLKPFKVKRLLIAVATLLGAASGAGAIQAAAVTTESAVQPETAAHAAA